MQNIKIKRIYEPTSPDDGFRVLVDRVWPRGMTKQAASIDLWLKDIAPTTALRKWFNHEPANWPLFQRRYNDELAEQTAILQDLLQRSAGRDLTLLYSAKDTQHNQALVLADVLLKLASEQL
ncbi:DUF488 domain-containing protein [Paraburkholderia aspalathi]|nr:DUF488 domain-containing protein [Paraburkholderia aspalathi]